MPKIHIINELQVAKLSKALERIKNSSSYRIINEIHAHSVTLGVFNTHQNLACRLLNTYALLKKPKDAQKIFDQIPNPDIVSWTSLQNLYLNIRQPMKALLLFSKLTASDFVKPDSHSIVAALSACARCKDLVNGKSIHGMVHKYLERPRPVVHNALIDMYCKNRRIRLAQSVFDRVHFKDVAIWTSLINGHILDGDIYSARKLFDEMPQRNVVTWTAMIVGYVRMKSPIKAMQLFQRMRMEDIGQDCSPTTVTVVALLSGCADIGALDFGSLVHGYVHKRVGFVVDVAVNNGLIDMYAKSGYLNSALKIFDGMKNRDLFSWTSMISGLALHGRGKYSLQVFDEMVDSGMIPNDVTFLSVLSACSHSGLVTEGERLFKIFVNNYNLKPKIEHYGCMVDILCRAGRLKEAIELIEGMPMKPDAVIWRSLLSSSLVHRDSDLAELAGKKVLELEPNDDAVYVLLCSAFRSVNRWEDVLRTVKTMRDQRIKKTPGCSWIEVNGIVHEFVAEASPLHISDDVLMVLNGAINHSKLDTNLILIGRT
ncbi:pentatricopeptide repeat-containing protein At2g20540-like [Olea europaea var. sylvestris]|uniref:pentatricopeptide repeat-containing protein At2g20540-like n=1 Tax=Olea europaea var. sylvestris TaxID=158386 RepID=UPI000C1D0CE1|nr:pentatricopeptide repeat-containing protein At2g20540-like [Olea europaea var. sylvestris]XP_022841607.1 pentatricopeptide repeat-containing protein At2g20540-like [Olea europaea var. sylvestris]XP_022841608.1 pentatricopeptide repeat-containing protein At2g20540-like [Olea europaea var. sylvestris]